MIAFSPLVDSAEENRELSVGVALVRTLEARGITHVFGIPGIHTIELYRGLADSSMTHVLAKHEQGAGFMADGFARATGRPAACFFITGPGITNALTAIGQGYSDSVPMLIVASTAATGDLGRQRGRLHESKNQRAMLEPVTAFAATAYKPEDIPEYLDRAFSLFESMRPRPVYIEIPLDVLALPATGDWQPRRKSVRPGPRPCDITRAAELLAGASKPALICGGGARGAAAQLRQLARHLALPTFCTIAGKGIMPGGDPLSLDALLHRADARDFLSESDVVLAVGTELAESEFLTTHPLPVSGELIRIDIDSLQLCDEQRTTLPILSDAAIAVSAIWELIGSHPARDRLGAEARVAAMREKIRSELTGLDAVYARALGIIRDTIPSDTLIFTDMTTIAYFGNALYPTPSEGRWLHPAGFGSLGYGLPASIGAKIASPGSPVIAIVGDGGFQFTLPELAVLAEHNLPLVVLIWNNKCFGQIKKGMLARNVTPVGVDYLTPNFQAMARAYGIVSHAPASAKEASKVLGAAIGRQQPEIIELTPELFEESSIGKH